MNAASVVGAPTPRSVDEVLSGAVDRCVDALTGCVIADGEDVTWPSWDLDAQGRARGVVAGRSDLYCGDAGIAHALVRLGKVLDRPDLTTLAETATATLGRRASSGSVGWLSGDAGVAQVRGTWQRGIPDSAQATDLTAGLAGILLSAARTHAPSTVAKSLVSQLRDRAVITAWGSAWPDPTESGDAARPLCGLAHGASGIAWALVEAAVVWPEVADEALTLADAGLRWEATWFDPIHGGWPDLREGVAWPALWCHGAAGAGAVRLRLVELAAAGLSTPWPAETVLAEAEVAVQACGSAVVSAAEEVLERPVPVGALTLCHGLGGPLAVLAQAARVLGEPRHVGVAREAAVAFVSALPEDAAAWPSGFKEADGDLGLMTGVAGTALVLASLRDPLDVPSPLLLA